MTGTASNMRVRQREEVPKPAPRKQPRRTMRLLAVVDGTERTNSVTAYLIAACDPRTSEVLVLNIQEKRNDARLRGYQSFKRDEIDARLIEDVGMPIVTSVCRVLEKAGIKAVPNVAVGDPVSTILRRASEDRCDVVVIGSDAPGNARMLLGAIGMSLVYSRAARVSAMAPVTVVVVK